MEVVYRYRMDEVDEELKLPRVVMTVMACEWCS